MENIVSKYITGISKKDKGVVGTISQIKNAASYQDLCKLIDSNSPAVLKNISYFVGNPFPKDYSELGRIPMVLQSIDLEKEIQWLLLALRNETRRISTFLKLKSTFEVNIINGNLEKSSEILDSIEKEIGVSLWTLENKLLLASLKTGIIGNTTLLEEFQNESISFDVRFLSVFFSEKVETEGGVGNFQEKILAAFNSYTGNDREQLISFFTFKLDPYEAGPYDPKSILEIEFKFSLVDRYLSLVKLCTLSLGASLEFPIQKFLYKLKNIALKTEDFHLNNIVNILQNKWSNEIPHVNILTSQVYRHYLKGDYKTCYSLSKSLLEKEFFDFDILILQVKSGIHLGIDEYDIKNSCILHRVASLIRLAYTKSGENEIFAPLFIKLAYVLESHAIGLKLLNFFATEFYDDNTLKIPASSSKRPDDPTFYKNYGNIYQANCLKLQIANLDENFAHSYYYNNITNQQYLNIELVSNNDLRKKFIEIDKEIANQENEKAIQKIIPLLEELKPLGYIHEKGIRRLYNCYVATNCMDKAIELFVTSHFYSSQLTKKLVTHQIIKKNRKNRFKNVEPNIRLPIFYMITKSEEVDVFNALRLYLNVNGVEQPSAIDIMSLDESKEYLKYFLDKVCTVEILKHSPVFQKQKDILIERINILHSIAQLDNENSGVYEREIDEYAKRLIILDGIKKLDESKIYINEEGLFEQLQRHQQTFDRLILLNKIYKENSFQTYLETLGEPLNSSYTSDSFISNFNVISAGIKELFLVIRQEFLFSQYGLVNYLSTRIRHGILEAAIRPIFQKLFLITEKGTIGEKYTLNTYWDSELTSSSISKERIERFHQELNELSREIDNYIQNIILSTKLQIKTESKNKQGLFDYIYTDKDISQTEVFKKLPIDFKQFVYSCFDELWKRTEYNLQTIRTFLKSEVNDSFIDILNKYEDLIQKIFRKEMLPGFFINTTICRDNLLVELKKISDWFVRSDTQMSDFKISDIIDVTNEYLKRSFLAKRLVLIKNIDLSCTIKGKYYVHFCDLFRLFMVNSLKYSNIPSIEIPLHITLNIDSRNIAKISITNPVDKNDLVKISKKIEQLKERNNDIEQLTGEIHSGFLKAMNIIKYDLNDRRNELDYFINQNNEFQVDLEINIKEILS